jgi:hypothetical protein
VRHDLDVRGRELTPEACSPTLPRVAYRVGIVPGSLEEALEFGFEEAVFEVGAEVGLLHRRDEAFFYTTAVFGLDRSRHLQVWVSLWDPAIQHGLGGRTLLGKRDDSAEAGTVARRLQADHLPISVIAVPVIVGQSVEAIVELGSLSRAFLPGDDRRVLDAMHSRMG